MGRIEIEEGWGSAKYIRIDIISWSVEEGCAWRGEEKSVWLEWKGCHQEEDDHDEENVEEDDHDDDDEQEEKEKKEEGYNIYSIWISRAGTFKLTFRHIALEEVHNFFCFFFF